MGLVPRSTRQPSNQRPELAGSGSARRRSAGTPVWTMCFRAFSGTYASALRVSRGVVIRRAWYVGEHPTGAVEDAIDGACETGTDGHHAAPERGRIVRLDDLVDVVALQGVVNDAELLALAAPREGVLERCDQSGAAKRRQAPDHAQGDAWQGFAARIPNLRR